MTQREELSPCCYCLRSIGRPGDVYTGFSTRVYERLYNHNHTNQGAKSTKRGRPWALLFSVHGFQDKREAMRFEHRMKKKRACSIPGVVRNATGGIDNRITTLFRHLLRGEWKDRSLEIRCYSGKLFPGDSSVIYIRNHRFVALDQTGRLLVG